MARVDDYHQARDLAAKELAAQSLEEISRRSGFERVNSSRLRIPFLDRIYIVDSPAFEFVDQNDAAAQVPLQEQVLLLHYLQGCRPRLGGKWIAYREIPGAGFYFAAFVKRAVDPLKKVFGPDAEGLRRAAARLRARPIETSSAAFEFDVLPYAPLQLILWEGDEEFPAEANILFDAFVGEYLSPEDAAWLASLTVYRLMALSR
jgi:Domain of unknown function (DUF3786)